MATIYFTTNAATGAGSLKQAFLDAQTGDVIMPDPDIFGAGESVYVTMTSKINGTAVAATELTLDAGATRLYVDAVKAWIIDHRGADSDVTEPLSFVFRGVEFCEKLCFYGVDRAPTNVVFEKCGFHNAATVNNSLQTSGYLNLTATDCVFSGALYGAAYLANIYGSNVFTRCTIAGNKERENQGNGFYGEACDAKYTTLIDCVCGEQASRRIPGADMTSAGFVNAPAQDEVDAASTDSPPDWQSWDLSLLESSTYATGAESAEGETDKLGLPRGWTNDEGETCYAKGAFEVVRADYYLIDEDGAWSSTRDKATPADPDKDAATYYVDASFYPLDSTLEGAALIVANKAQVDLAAAGIASLSKAVVGEYAALFFGWGTVDDLTLCGNSNTIADAASTLTLYGNLSIALEDFSASSATIKDGATLSVAGDAALTSLTLEDGAALTIADGVVLKVESGSVDPGATIKSDGRAYLVAGASFDCASATLDGVTFVVSGAGLTSFSATMTAPKTATLTWTQTNASAPVLLEVKSGDGWETIASDASGTYEIEYTTAPRGVLTFRAFDGDTFLTDAAWSGSFDQYCVVCGIVPAPSADVNWEVVTEVVGVNGTIKPGQAVTILARIYDAFDNDVTLLSSGDNIARVVYTCQRKTKSLYDSEWVDVEGHSAVEVEPTAVLEALQTSDAWTIDNVGYAFALTPDVTEYPLFSDAGSYRIKVTVTLKEGNPVTFYAPITVEN